MRWIDWLSLARFLGAAGACSSATLSDPFTILDPPNHSLRGKTPADDRPESDCDPVKRPDGTLRYPCLVHKFPDYLALLDRVSELEAELKSCQSGAK